MGPAVTMWNQQLPDRLHATACWFCIVRKTSVFICYSSSHKLLPPPPFPPSPHTSFNRHVISLSKCHGYENLRKGGWKKTPNFLSVTKGEAFSYINVFPLLNHDVCYNRQIHTHCSSNFISFPSLFTVTEELEQGKLMLTSTSGYVTCKQLQG